MLWDYLLAFYRTILKNFKQISEGADKW